MQSLNSFRAERSDTRHSIPWGMDALQIPAGDHCHSHQQIPALQRLKEAPRWKWEWQCFCTKRFLCWSEDNAIQDHGLNVSASGNRLWWVKHQRLQSHKPGLAHMKGHCIQHYCTGKALVSMDTRTEECPVFIRHKSHFYSIFQWVCRGLWPVKEYIARLLRCFKFLLNFLLFTLLITSGFSCDAMESMCAQFYIKCLRVSKVWG